MKVKNIAFSGFMASILMAGAAYAEGAPTLATDQYVIQGVNYAISQAQDYTDDVIGIAGLPTDTTVTEYIESAVSAAETALARKQDALPATSGKSGMVLKVGESGLEWADDANSQYDDTALKGRVKALEDTGVTADKISAIASNTAAIGANASAIAEKQTQLNATQLAAVNSGIDETKVGKYDAYNTTLTQHTTNIESLSNTKQDKIDSDNKLSASLVSGLATVATSGNVSDLNNDSNFQNADDVAAAIGAELVDHDNAPEAHADIREDISDLQGVADALEDDIEGLSTEINAANTGLKARMTAAETSITNKADAADVYTKTQVDGFLDNKQASLSDAQITAANSGITGTKVSGYDSHVADGTIHVTSTEKSTWSGKQDALSEAQMNAANSGITAGKVSTYDGYASTIAGKQDTISDLSAIRSGAAAGATALQNSCGSGYCLVTPTGGMVSIETVSENSQWGSTTGGSGTN